MEITGSSLRQLFSCKLHLLGVYHIQLRLSLVLETYFRKTRRKGAGRCMLMLSTCFCCSAGAVPPYLSAVSAGAAQVSISTDPYAVFTDADWALMIGAKPRGPGQERADLLDQNGRIFVDQVRLGGKRGWVGSGLRAGRPHLCGPGAATVGGWVGGCAQCLVVDVAEGCLDVQRDEHVTCTGLLSS
jgi:hypothetical protein